MSGREQTMANISDPMRLLYGLSAMNWRSRSEEGDILEVRCRLGSAGVDTGFECCIPKR
jgi:hypothetical protein